MIETEKKKLTLSVDSEIVEKAKEQDINISEITEKVLRAFTSSSKIADKEKLYKNYQDLFNLMLPLLQKFKVTTIIARDVSYDWPEQIGEDESGNPIYADPEPTESLDISLQPDGKLDKDYFGEVKINDINIKDFLRPQDMIEEFLDSILKGVEYRKKQSKEIEMAKTIIDAITKGTISKSKSKGKGGKRK